MKRLFPAICTAILIGSCASPVPIRMYSLEAQCKTSAAGKPGPSVALAKVKLPSYLEGAPIVVRLSRNEVALSDASVWVQPMREAFPACVTENLRRLLGTLEVNSSPATTRDYDRLVQIEVIDFTRGPSAQVHLDVIWRLFDPKNRRQLAVRRKTYDIAVADDEYASIAVASSEAMAQFCVDLCADLGK